MLCGVCDSLFAVCCWLSDVCRLLRVGVVCCVLIVVCCGLVVVCCVVCVDGYLLRVGGWSLCVAGSCCVLFAVVDWLVFVVRCVLSVVCCVFVCWFVRESSLFVVCRVLCVVWCVLMYVRWLLRVVYCLGVLFLAVVVKSLLMCVVNFGVFSCVVRRSSPCFVCWVLSCFACGGLLLVVCWPLCVVCSCCLVLVFVVRCALSCVKC